MDREHYMQKALEQARLASAQGEVPVGAVIVKDGAVIAAGRNRREQIRSALGHAEIEAIENACEALGDWRLEGCTLYVTLEPCPMCAGAILNARIPEVVYGARDRAMGACGSVINLFEERFGYKPRLYGGVLESDCSKLLSAFFSSLRA